MKRLALKSLEAWKEKAQKRPLLIRGARQVGKTWLVREHARSYENFVELNLEKQPQFLSLFKNHYGNPQKLLQEISLLSGAKVVPQKTLLFIDEIQESSEALMALRYFKEEFPQQYIIAAGSLLEFSFSDLSFPVGRIEFFHLFPLNFEEYLSAMGRDDLIGAIHQVSMDDPKSLSDPVHELLLDYFHIYSLLGGLPEVVKTYMESHDLKECQNIQQILVATYREDFHKYSSREKIENLRLIFQSIPRFLGQKFKYSRVDPYLKSRELSKALLLLLQAGLAYQVYHSSSNGLPLDAQINSQKFKIFFLDAGLCHRILGVELSQLYLERKNILAHRGGLAEQIVAQELISYTSCNESPRLHYWHRESKSSSAEVDFVIPSHDRILPIEVKSNRPRGIKSLKIFLEEKKEYTNRGLIVSGENFSSQPLLKIPFYSLMKLFHSSEYSESGNFSKK